MPAPAGLTATPQSASHLLLTWANRAADAEALIVERRTGGADAWQMIARLPPDAERYESGGCLERTTYEHRVVAVRGAHSAPSAAASATTPEAFAAPQSVLIAPSSPANRRNSEGAMLRLRNGHLLMVYGQHTGHDDLSPCRLVRRVSADGGQTWSDPELILADGRHTVGHAGLARLADGRIGLSYIVIRGRDDAETLFRTSDDEGRTWSEPATISDGSYDYITAPNDALRVFDGGRLIQACHARSSRGMVVLVFTSDDGGRTWVNRTGAGLTAPGGSGMNEASIARLGTPGHLLLFARTGGDWYWESRSPDNGSTWSEARQANVRNPMAPAKLYNVPGSSKLLLVQNPYVAGGRPWPNGERWILASRVSEDDGRTWGHYRQLEYVRGNEHWFHYPAVLFDGPWVHLIYHEGDNRVHHQGLRYRRVDRQWLLGGSEPPPPRGNQRTEP